MKVKVYYVDNERADYNWGLGNWEGVIIEKQLKKLKEDFFEVQKNDSDFLERAMYNKVTIWELVQIIIEHEDANFTKEEIEDFLKERLEIEWLEFCKDCITEYKIEI